MKEKHIESYIVYEDGRIFSKHTNKYLTPYRKPDGYEYVMLYLKGRKERWYVHRLVASAFLPQPEGKTQVHHIDHCRHNNRLDNIMWVDASENMEYSFEHENGAKKRKTFHFIYKGEKVTVVDLLAYCKEYKLCNSHMSEVYNGKRKSHKGYTKY